jgi:hypothetical protein
MNSEPPPLPQPPPRRLALALILAFVPATIVLLLLSLNLPGNKLAVVCLPAALVSVGCCVWSSFLLFRRSTTVTLVVGVFLAIMNAFITLGLGCAALLGNLNGH